VAGCSGAAKLDPCTGGTVVRVADGDTAATALVADDRGYVAFWVGGDGGLWAVRPGIGTATRLRTWTFDFTLSVARVSGGFLACGASRAVRFDTPRAGECDVINGDLAVASTSRPSVGVIFSLGRTQNGLVAIAYRDEQQDLVTVHVDETGQPLDSATPAPCADFGLVWSAAGVACLVPSDPQCGAPLPDAGFAKCRATLRVYRDDGSVVLAVEDISPGPGFNEPFQAHLASSGDGWLVSWIEQETWHGRLVSATGAVQTLPDVPAPQTDNSATGLVAVPGGYAATLSEETSGYVVPNVFIVTAEGQERAPARLADPSGDLQRHFTGSLLESASFGGGFGLLWEAASADDEHHLLFRAMGCPQ
jgi:hypothetical protein